MKIARPDYGYQYGDAPVLPVGAIGVGLSNEIRVGDGVTPFASLPIVGDIQNTPIINSLSDIPYGTPEGRVFAIKGASQTPVLFRKNLERDPKATSVASFNQALGALSLISDFHSSAVRWTRSSTGSARVNILAPSLTLLAAHSIRFKIRCSTSINLSVLYRPAGVSNAAGQATFQSLVPTPAGESEVICENVALTSQPNANGSFALTFSDGAIGQTVDVTDIQIEQHTTVGSFFYGGSSVSAPYAVAWDGTTNNSASTMTRTPFALSMYSA